MCVCVRVYIYAGHHHLTGTWWNGVKRWGLVGGMEKIKMEVKRMEEEEGRWRWREKSA